MLLDAVGWSAVLLGGVFDGIRWNARGHSSRVVAVQRVVSLGDDERGLPLVLGHRAHVLPDVPGKCQCRFLY